MQFQADILQKSIDRPVNVESTALGVGMLAGLATGFWSCSREIQNVRRTDRIFKAKMTLTEKNTHQNAWETAVKQAQNI